MTPDVFGPEYASAYDHLYQDKDYGGEVDLLELLFSAHSGNSVRSVLDVGCGTGGHTLELARRGYRTMGVDRSPTMLAAAREKAAALELGRASFVEGDAVSLGLGRRFDATLLMFAVLGYQLENSDVRAALEAARRHLDVGGLLIGDVWYGPAVLHLRPSERSKPLNTPTGALTRHSSGTLDIRRHRCTVHFSLIHETTGKEIHEEHEVRYFFPLELELLLELAGFRLVELSSFPDRAVPDETTWNVLFVGRAT